MKIADIKVADVLAGKNWGIISPDGAGLAGPHMEVREAENFSSRDHGIFSAVLRCANGTEHPALAVKILPQGGLHTDTFVFTRIGWLNIFDDGFARALGLYPTDIYPFDLFIGRPWIGDKELAAEGLDAFDRHTKTFDEAVDRLRTIPPDNRPW